MACRAVVFLDTFEALQAGAFGDAQRQLAEKPVRDLYVNLTCVLLVIVGRDRLTWDEADPGWAEHDCLQQHLLGGLSRYDAADFLGKCGIAPGPLREAILRACTDDEAAGREAYYPFSLGLCADAVAAERAGGREPDPATFDIAPGDYDRLAQRFLKSLHDRHTELWITSLAQTPRFDEAAARDAFSPTRDVHQDAAWDALRDYSFVQQAADPGWFRLHAQMADALRQRLNNDSEEFARMHDRWRTHWQTRAGSDVDDFAALAWSHEFARDPDEARQAWVARAERARAASKMTPHYELLDWWAATGIEDREARDRSSAAVLVSLGVELAEATLGNRSTNLKRAIGCYSAALRVYTEADFPADWAMTQNKLGNAYWSLPTGDRGGNLRMAIGCYTAALRVRTEADFPADWATTQNNLGNAFRKLPTGDRGGNLRMAIGCYTAALRVRTEADFPADWATTQYNLGLAFRELGDREAAVRAFDASARGYGLVGDVAWAERAESRRDKILSDREPDGEGPDGEAS
jgi:tetratricopeptide (TPR) repeat protein